ncbi:hypothetical protein [Candidatus Halobonum tyrrellensis]|uniref:Uncharacterized protein n=1 Tax=Candidatus Halobonum tyrrellensis G22 TaxID=1324957 RepID=V4HBL3_9EURY|nr:hypothetical protein [Candidatus Halobonum tyrrellensis]ESP88100.1 hypothetical protein K933_10432 [Candidatus Halobonum tyrrellensis G22]
MATNSDRSTDRRDGGRDDSASDGDAGTRPDRDAESTRGATAARRSFEADERAAARAERERTRGGDERARERDRERNRRRRGWNAVGVVTSLGATCLFGVGGLLARSSTLVAAASVTFVAVGVLLARSGVRRLP